MMEKCLDNLYLPKTRKNLIEKLKLSKDLVWFEALIKSATTNQLVYLSEVLTECFKSARIKLTTDTVALVVAALRTNIATISNQPATTRSPDELSYFGVSCLGVLLFLKSQFSSHIDTNFTKDLPESLVLFIKETPFASRDVLILVMPLAIHIDVECLHQSPHQVYLKGITTFRDSLYSHANWQSCLLKLYIFTGSEENIVLDLLDFCLTELLRNTSFHFIYFDIIVTCLRRYRKLCCVAQDIVKKVFSLTVYYTDNRGFHLTNLSEEIQLICINLCPDLLLKVEKLSKGPWYSGNSIIYLTMFLGSSNSINEQEICVILEDLVGHLGYNRIDHGILKAIKTLLNKFLTKDNFMEFLRICLSCVSGKPGITTLVALYIAPLFNSHGVLVCQLQHEIVGLIDRSESDNIKIVLYCMFYNNFKSQLSDILIKSKLNRSSNPEVQTLLITLVTKNIALFHAADASFILDTYTNILTVLCPTVRQHAVTSLHCLIPFANTPTFSQLVDLFLDHISPEVPYHAVALSLSFFTKLAGMPCVAARTQELQFSLSKLDRISDNDVRMLANKLRVALTISPAGIPEAKSRSSCVGEFMETVSRIEGLELLKENNVAVKASSLKEHLHELNDATMLQITDASSALILELLGMISHSDNKDGCKSGSYTAPSFEETFVIIKSNVGGDESSCKEIGAAVWETISSLVELLCAVGKSLTFITMELFLRESGDERYINSLLTIGEACLHCIFRCRQRSVTKAACDALRVLSMCTAAFPTTHHIPGSWVDSLLEVLCTPTSSSLSRRSAGLPEAIEAALQCDNPLLTQRAVSHLLRTAHQPYADAAETQDLVQVHALHMLRLVLSSAKLRLQLLHYTAEICALCYAGFIHKLWVVRNASFLLFAELVNFILGHKNTEFPCGYRSCLSVGELQQHHGGVYSQILRNIEEHCHTPRTCPSIYLSLMLISKLYSDPCRHGNDKCRHGNDKCCHGNDKCCHVDDKCCHGNDKCCHGDSKCCHGNDKCCHGNDKCCHGDESEFGGALFLLLSSSTCKVRSVTARTLVLVCPPAALARYARLAADEIGKVCQNRQHGLLSFLLECSKAGVVGAGAAVASLVEKSCFEEMLAVNVALVLQIVVALSDSRDANEPRFVNVVSEIEASCLGSRHQDNRMTTGYPADVADYIGVWYLVNSAHEMAFKHIQLHHLQLTQVFWDKVEESFYKTFSEPGALWILEALADPRSRYVEQYMSNFAFHVLNSNTFTEFHISPEVFAFLTRNVAKYAHICVLLAVSYSVEVDCAALLEIVEGNHRFDTCNTTLMSRCYSIQRFRCILQLAARDVTMTTQLAAAILASAILHAQSEDETLKEVAIKCCVAFGTSSENYRVTPRHAIACAVAFIRTQREKRGTFLSALNKIREKVLASSGCEGSGFDIECNAHFDKNLFLKLTSNI